MAKHGEIILRKNVYFNGVPTRTRTSISGLGGHGFIRLNYRDQESKLLYSLSESLLRASTTSFLL